MSLSISIRFLTGRAHLHPWQTHHSEGRVEWPPSQWRLLRALVAVAGRGLTTLPLPDFVFTSSPSPKKGRGKKKAASKENVLAIDYWQDQSDDIISINRLAALLHALSATPTIWLPKTAGGHTRQYFPIHESGMVKNSGSAVFDTFATVRKDQPLVFHWPDVNLEKQQLEDLKLILSRITYFGRAESWCRADAHTGDLKKLPDMVSEATGQTHWCCVCIEDGGKPEGKEYRDYTLERRLAPCKDVPAEVKILFPRTNRIASTRPEDDAAFERLLENEPAERSLLRCLLRESGQDIKDGLERPIGTRWVHYAVPRAIYNVPRPSSQPRPRDPEAVDLVVYALNTASVHRPVLPPLTDTLLVADRFRSAAMALCGSPSRALSGRESNNEPCKGHDHAFWWPMDEDNDGFIDHVYIWVRGGLQPNEVDALRRLNRLRQRGGRPDLLVTPVFVGRVADYKPWQGTSNTFVSATPYFCPLYLSHGRTGGGRIRPVTRVIRESLLRQGLISDANEVEAITELVFDYDPDSLPTPAEVTASIGVAFPPRQFFPVIEPPGSSVPLAERSPGHQPAYPRACRKDPDQGHPFGVSIGLVVSNGSRFIRALSFCRNRRGRQVKGYGRMLEIRFQAPRVAHPFAIGSECHFGLGLFVPVDETADRPVIAERV